MQLSMYQASVPLFLQVLACQAAILEKAARHAAEKKIEPSALLAARLYPDMFPFTRQVQLTADFPVRACARLAGVEIPSHPDTETSFGELLARIAKAAAFVKRLKPSQIDGSEDKALTIPAGKETMNFTGRDYLIHFAIPNFLFHATTAYDILRHNGVELGKRDFLQPPEAMP